MWDTLTIDFYTMYTVVDLCVGYLQQYANTMAPRINTNTNDKTTAKTVMLSTGAGSSIKYNHRTIENIQLIYRCLTLYIIDHYKDLF